MHPTRCAYEDCGEALTDSSVTSRLDPRIRYCDTLCRDAAEPRCLRCRDLPQCPDRADGYCSSDCAMSALEDEAADRAYDEWRDMQMEVA